MLFRYGPDHRHPRWVWLSPGSVGATLLWLAGTAAFGLYVSRFGNYGATYGSLSAVIVTLTWLWLSAYVFLLGAELNAELERQVEGEARCGKDSPVASRTEPSPTNISEPVGIVASLAGSGAIATAGLALLRRGRPFGAAVIAMAALSAWRKRPGA